MQHDEAHQQDNDGQFLSPANSFLHLSGFWFIVLLIQLMPVVRVTAQEALMIRFSKQDGLPSNVIYSVLQDSKGFIWFATDEGVSQFDGHQFHNYSIKDGLPDNEILCINEDRYHRLWLVSYNTQPAYIFNEKVFNVDNDSLCRKIQRAGIRYSGAIKNEEGFDYFLGNQFCRIDKNDIQPADKNIFSGKAVNYMPYKSGRYLVTDSAVYYHERGKPNRAMSFGSLSTFIFGDRLYVSAEWKAYKFGVLCYKLNGEKITLESKRNTESQIFNFVNLDGKLICLTEKGVYNYNTQSGLLSAIDRFPQRLAFNNLLVDKEKNIWLTSLSNGVFMYPNSNAKVYTSVSGLKHNDVFSITAQSGKLFAGYNDGSFDYITDKTIRNINVFTPRVASVVKHIFQAGSNRFIACTDKGMYNLEQGSSLTVEALSYKCGIQKNGSYLFGYTRGASSYDVKKRQVKELFHKRTTAITVDTTGDIWLGTLEGLFLYHNDSVRPVNLNAILNKCRITGLATTNDNTLVIATHKDGLFIYRNKQLFRITTQQDISSNGCKKVLADHTNTIWLCTDNGLDRISIEDLNHPVVYKYSESDGLPTSRINDFDVDSNQVYVATSLGIVILPYKLQQKAFLAPEIYIRTIKIKDSILQPVAEIILAPSQNDLQIEYTAISFIVGKNMQYRYTLEGKSTDTSFTTLQAIKLSELNPGKYRLLLWARVDEKGPWSLKPAIFSFHILTPFWLTLWFTVVVVSVILLIALLLYRRNIIRIKFTARQKSVQERRMAELEMQALRAQINPHFIFNALNSIQHYYASNDERKANHYMNLFAQLIRRTLHYSKTHWLSLQEEIETIETYIQLEQMRFKDAFEYELIKDNTLNLDQTQIPAMLLQPYVENAINHGLLRAEKETGLILRLRIIQEDKKLICSIEDNGIGMRQAAKHKKPGHNSMGMLINQQRIETINLMYKTNISVLVEDKNDINPGKNGTIITLQIPQD